MLNDIVQMNHIGIEIKAPSLSMKIQNMNKKMEGKERKYQMNKWGGGKKH